MQRAPGHWSTAGRYGPNDRVSDDTPVSLFTNIHGSQHAVGIYVRVVEAPSPLMVAHVWGTGLDPTLDPGDFSDLAAPLAIEAPGYDAATQFMGRVSELEAFLRSHIPRMQSHLNGVAS